MSPDMKPGMSPEKQETCPKCGGSGWIQTGTRRDSGRHIPITAPCDCRKNESTTEPQGPETDQKISDFIGRVVIDSPEQFRN